MYERGSFTVRVVCPFDPLAIRVVGFTSSRSDDLYVVACNGCDYFGAHQKGCFRCVDTLNSIFTFNEGEPVEQPFHFSLKKFGAESVWSVRVVFRSCPDML